MKKSIILSVLLIMMCMPTIIYAVDEYEFSMEYQGDVIVGEEKQADVILRGTNATPYPRVIIKVDQVSGPATPSLHATDSNGTLIDIVAVGYWGPPAGFAVGGTFENKTPVTAEFSKAGTYVIKLSLLNLDDNNNVLTSKEFTIEVKDAQTEPPVNNIIPTNNTVIENTVINNVTNEAGNAVANNEVDNTIEEIPQTGATVIDYIICISCVIAASLAVYKISKRK